MRRFFSEIWWRWRAWRIRRAYRRMRIREPETPPEPAIETYEGTALWHRPYDLHIDLANFRNLLPLLREKRQQPDLTVEDLVQEAIGGACEGEAKRRGLVYAGRFEEGEEVIMQWRSPSEAAHLLADETAKLPAGMRAYGGHERRGQIV